MLRPIYRAPSLSSHFCPLPLASFASPLRPHICAGPVSIAGRNALRTSAVSSSHLHLAHFHSGRVSKRPLGPPSSRCQLVILAPKAPISADLLAPPSQSQLPTPTHTLPRSPTSPGLLRGGPWETSSDPPTPCQCPGVPLTGTACSCQAAISVLIGTLAATLVAAATLLALRGQPPPAIPLSYPFHNIAPSAPHPILPE